MKSRQIMLQKSNNTKREEFMNFSRNSFVSNFLTSSAFTRQWQQLNALRTEPPGYEVDPWYNICSEHTMFV